MIKAISTVIASILMLMIVVGLGGTAYLFISGTFTGKTATTFEVIDEINGTVTIRNSGTETITRITATLNGNPVNIAVVPNIDGTAAYWSMNDGNPNQIARDSSGNNNHGTLGSGPGGDINDPSWTSGKFGDALQFDGTVKYAEVRNLGITTSFTIAGWVKPNFNGFGGAASGYGTFVGYDGDHRILISTGGELLAQFGTNFNSRARLTDNTWAHIVYVWDSSLGKEFYYINGEFDNEQLQILRQPTWNNRFYVGQYDLVNYYFNGLIDEVAIFNKALSGSEIKQLYSGLVSPGQLAKIKPLTELPKGTHTLRLCTSTTCNTAILTIN